MIEEAIKNFPKQFAFEPEIKNAEKLKSFESIVIGGMGGSGLVAGILRALKPEMDIAAHHDYGLPAYLKDVDKRLFIAISYSGNTEETIDFFREALKRRLNVAVIAVGGKLLELVKESETPFIQIPYVGSQPRLALGIMLRAVLILISDKNLYQDCEEFGKIMRSEEIEAKGKNLADKIYGRAPVIYSSRRNLPLAYNWKVDFNEGAKIPAFYNVFPEVNHNEMQGFDVNNSTKALSEKLHFILLKDIEDHPQIIQRMDILKKLYEDRNLPVTLAELEGVNRVGKIFNSLILAAWAAYYTAKLYKTDPEGVPMVEEFKKLIE